MEQPGQVNVTRLIDNHPLSPLQIRVLILCGLVALLDGDRALPRRVVLNLDRVAGLSSRAVGMIVAHSLRLERQGGGLRLCRASAPVLALLQHLKLPMLVAVHHELDDAVLSSWERD